MPLSWNEIKDRALAFSKEREHESSEDAEARNEHPFDFSFLWMDLGLER